MGAEIAAEEFTAADYARFRARLEESLAGLGRLLGRPGFGAGPASIGAEVELCLIDAAGRPLPLNQAIQAAAADPRVALELNRFNLELNSSPVLLAGRPFTHLQDELCLLLDRADSAASGYAGRLALIGILPTLELADLGPGMLTDTPRYRALGNGLRRLRRSPFHIQVTGRDPLELTSEGIGFEGANTSFQVHLRVAPADFTRTYNAVQLATAPVLAVSANSPTLLGHQLWEETRIALFKQAVDERRADRPRRGPARAGLGAGWLRGGPLELFTQSVRWHPPLLPVLSSPGPPAGGEWRPLPLDELRLHQGTVWAWNRVIYDPAAGGHLRIEMRALPAGPTVTDMMANAAFLIGTSLWIAGQDPRWTYALPFERADRNFHRAAQRGLSAELSWPCWQRDQMRTLPAAELVAELVPAAREGLRQAGVDQAETDRLLGVIAARAASGQTGATWQRAALAAAGKIHARPRALAVMLDQYLRCAASQQPVHTWPA